jgi:hypothetical protein
MGRVCPSPPSALTKTALALLGPLQTDAELQEIFSVAEDKEQRLRTLLEELGGADHADAAADDDGAAEDDDGDDDEGGAA